MKYRQIIPLARPVKATLTIPGSKSYTNRALLLAALSLKPVIIKNPLLSDDTQAMIACLQTLGIKTIQHPEAIEVVGSLLDVTDTDFNVDADLSGTTLRFLVALCAIIPGRQTLHGKAGLNARPIGDLVDGLRQLGARIDYAEKEGYPPLVVSSSSLQPGTLKINGQQSSQYLSAILMIAPLIGTVDIVVSGDLRSEPYVDMTIETMKRYGVTVTKRSSPSAYHIATQQAYSCTEYTVEGDVSSASYFAAIASLTGSTITLRNMNPESLQADMNFLEILEQMGNTITSGNHEVTIAGQGVQPVNVDMQDYPDQAQTLAVLAAFVNGVTTITGVQSLRVKETERIVALEQELAKMGIKTSSTADTLVIHGGRPRAASIATYGDHRMAMAFAVAGSKLPGMEIEDPDVVAKTFPDFWDKLRQLGIATTEEGKP